MPDRRARRGSGFTLIEILITIGILSVGILSVLAMFTVGISAVADSSRDNSTVLLTPSIVASLQVALNTPNPTGSPANSFLLQMPELQDTGPDIRETYFILPTFPTGANPWTQSMVYRFPVGKDMTTGQTSITGTDSRLSGVSTYRFKAMDVGTPVQPLAGLPSPAASVAHWTLLGDFVGDYDDLGSYSFDFVVYPAPSQALAVDGGTKGPYIFEVRIWFGYDPAGAPKFDDPSLDDPASPSAQARQYPVHRFPITLTPSQ